MTSVARTPGRSMRSAAIDRVRIYVDGEPQALEAVEDIGSFPDDIEDTTAHFAIGSPVSTAGAVCASSAFAGELDEIAAWDSVLTPEHASELHQRGRLGTPLWPRGA